MSVKVREKKKGSGVWWIFINHAGSRRSKQVGLKREAERIAAIISGRLASGDLGLLEDKEVVRTFKEYAAIWLSGTVPATLKASTQDDYKQIDKKHLAVAPFYNSPVNEIKKGDLKRYLRSKLQKGLAVSTVTHIKNAIGGVFNEAIDDEVIDVNPVHGIRLGSRKDESRKPKIEPLEVDEVSLLLSTCQEKSPKQYPLVLLLIMSGMRIGEGIALKWNDIDFNDRTILVRRNFVRNRIEESTKNGKERRVDMTKQLATCLRTLKRERAEKALKDGTGSISSGWLFPSRSVDKPIDYASWRKRHYYPLLEAAGVRKVRIHDLRHSYASIMLHAGCDLFYISRQLGHSSIKVTADVYGHLLRGNGEKPVEKMGELLHQVAPHAHPEQKKGSSN